MNEATDEQAKRLLARAEGHGEGTLRLRAGVGSAVGESILVVDADALSVVTRRSYLEPFEVHVALEHARIERGARGEAFVAQSAGEELRIELGYGEAEAVEALLATRGGIERFEGARFEVAADGARAGDEARDDDERRAIDEARIALLTLLDRPRVMLAWLEARRAAGSGREPSPWVEAVARARGAQRGKPRAQAATNPPHEPRGRTKRARIEPRPRANAGREDVGAGPTSAAPDEPSSDEASLGWLVGLIVAIVLGGLLLSATLR